MLNLENDKLQDNCDSDTFSNLNSFFYPQNNFLFDFNNYGNYLNIKLENLNIIDPNEQNYKLKKQQEIDTEKAPINNINENNLIFIKKKSYHHKESNIPNNTEKSTERETKKRKKYIRKNKNENGNKKDRQDNKIIKLKTYLINKLHKRINELLKPKGKELCKVNTIIKEKIKKDYNINLINKTLKDIYLSNNICTKYTKDKWKTNNSDVINYIYNIDKDKIIIQLLNLTYYDIFQIFIRKKSDDLLKKLEGLEISEYFPDIKDFYDYIKTKTKEDDEYVQNYVNGGNGQKGVEEICLEIVYWFEQKKGRKGKK